MANDRVDGGTLKTGQSPDWDNIQFSDDKQALIDALMLIWKRLMALELRAHRGGI